jgi:hypothetical protein
MLYLTIYEQKPFYCNVQTSSKNSDCMCELSHKLLFLFNNLKMLSNTFKELSYASNIKQTINFNNTTF